MANISLTCDAGMQPRPDWNEWLKKCRVLTLRQRGVYLYLRYYASMRWPVNLRQMGNDLSDRASWQSAGALPVNAIRETIEQLEAIGLVYFDDDDERRKVLGAVGW